MRQLLKKTWYQMTPEHPKTFLEARIGWVVGKVLPKRLTEKYYDGIFTANDFLSRSIRRELVRQYYLLPDKEKMSVSRKKMWGGLGGLRWHDLAGQEYLEKLAVRESLIDALSNFVIQHPEFNTVLEIGTGNGLFLDTLEKRLTAQVTTIEEFIGLDLNNEQIQKNRKAIQNPKVRYEYQEVQSWIAERQSGGVIFVSVGVLEFFLKGELEELLQTAKTKLSPVAFAIIEPVNMDLEKDFDSSPRGNLGFSSSINHNYPHLFSKYGYKLKYKEITSINPHVKNYYQVCIIAEAR